MAGGRGCYSRALSRLGEGKLAHSAGKTFADTSLAGKIRPYLKVDWCLGRRKFYVVVRVTRNAAGDQVGRAIGLNCALERH